MIINKENLDIFFFHTNVGFVSIVVKFVL